MNLRLLTCAAIAALLASPAARADDDDFAGSVGVGVGSTGFDFRVNVQDGTQRQQQGNVQVKSGSREEISSSKPGESFKLTYDSNGGKTSFKVLAPEGLGLRVSEGGRIVLEDSIPTSFDAIGGKFYRFEVFTPQAVVFDKKFEAKSGMLGVLAVAVSTSASVNVTFNTPPPPPANAPPPPPPPPAQAVASCMGNSDYRSISGEIGNESFGNEKLRVLEDAMEDRTVCVAQVMDFVELFTFGQEKLDALKLLAPKIVDPENNYKVYGAFTFDSEKAEAKKILKRK